LTGIRPALVLGLGNPILTDDGVGIHVVRAVQSRYASLRPGQRAAEFAEGSVGGLRLLDLLAGYERVILIDAIQTAGGVPGAISCLSPRDVQSSLHAGSTHDFSFQEALAWGREIGLPLPDDDAIVIVAIEAEDVLSFSVECTPAVVAAIPRAAQVVVEMLETRMPNCADRASAP
jgi:hydrogenase maturation protease